jgi:hypothetical protein
MTVEEVPTGPAFEAWALQEFVRLGTVIRGLNDQLVETRKVADDRLEEIVGVRATLAGGKSVKLVNRNQFGEIVSVEEFTPPETARRALVATSTGSKGPGS